MAGSGMSEVSTQPSELATNASTMPQRAARATPRRATSRRLTAITGNGWLTSPLRRAVTRHEPQAEAAGAAAECQQVVHSVMLSQGTKRGILAGRVRGGQPY